MTIATTNLEKRTASVPFTPDEYESRLERVKLSASGTFDALLITDCANICYLTGYDAWSFYVPQVLVVPISSDSPFFIVREQDVACGWWTTYLSDENILGYPDDLLADDKHPMSFVANELRDRGLSHAHFGIELDSTGITPRGLDWLKGELPTATFLDSQRLVDWERLFKTEAEIAAIREAAVISDHAMTVAHETIEPGVREATVAAAVYSALIDGVDNIIGSNPLRPCMMRGGRTETPHLSWMDDTYQNNEPVVIELGGHRHNYAAGLTRTLHLGAPPTSYTGLDAAVREGREAALEVMRPGNSAEEVEAAWRAAINKRGVYKNARIGYSIGLSFPTTTWVEPTVSLAPGDATLLRPNMAIHLMLEVLQDGIGHGLSEVILIGDSDPEPLSRLPQEMRIK